MIAAIFSFVGMYGPSLTFYGALAAVAVWATWVPGLRLLGVCLASGFIVSNVIWFAAPITWRAGPYSAIEVLVAAAAFAGLDHVGGCSRRCAALIMLMGVNLVSICLNVALVLNTPPAPRQVFFHEVTTNLCFAVECLLAAGVGVAHGYRSGRFTWKPRLRRRVVAAGVAREKGPR